MITTIRLTQLECIDEADGSGRSEPYLWPIFFKIDNDTVTAVMQEMRNDGEDFGVVVNAVVDSQDFVPVSTYFYAPGGPHNNVGGSMDAGQTKVIPEWLGTWKASIRTGPLLNDENQCLIGCIAVLLEEDSVPSSSQIKQIYTHTFSPTVLSRIKDKVNASVTSSLNDNNGGLGGGSDNESGLVAASEEEEIRKELVNQFNDQIPGFIDRDDVIGAAVFTANVADLNKGKVSFQRLWIEATKSEDGSYRLSGSAESDTMGAESDPVGYSYSADNTQHVIFTGEDSRIHELWFKRGKGWSHAIPVNRSDIPAVVGAPSGYTWAVDNTQHIVFRGNDNNIHELWFARGLGWNYNNLTIASGVPQANAITEPWGYVWAKDKTQHVIYRDRNFHIQELWFAQGHGWNHNDLTVAANAPECRGRPMGYGWNHPGWHNLQKVIYRGKDNHIHELTFRKGQGWSWADLSKSMQDGTSIPLAASDPRGAVYPWGENVSTNPERHYITYRGDDGHLHLINWHEGIQAASGGVDPIPNNKYWQHEDLTEKNSFDGHPGNYMLTPHNDTTPSVYVDNDNILVAYRDLRGCVMALHRRVSDETYTRLSFLNIDDAIPASGDPCIYYWGVDDTLHITFRDKNWCLHEFWIPRSKLISGIHNEIVDWNHSELATPI